ncbi:hypothetical protein GF407_05965 [candidate division KSB1 bacterium]|nr:hypothetical protein [candidate division KSB1 bacterium]
MIQYSKADSPMSPQGFFEVVRKRRFTIFLTFAVIFLGVVLVTFLMPPTYRSSAKVMVNYLLDLDTAHLLNLVRTQDRSYYDQLNSETVIFRSRAVLEPVVVKLRNPDYPVENEQLSSSELDNAVLHLKNRINVERDRDTNVLIVSCEDRNPNWTKKIVDEVVNQYIEQRPLLNRDERALEFIDKQIQSIEKRIHDIKARGMEYQQKSDLIAPGEQGKILLSSLAVFDRELTKIRSDRMSKEAQVKVIQEQLEKGDDPSLLATESSAYVSKFDYINSLKKALLELELEKERLALKFTDKHPKMVAIVSDIEETREKYKQAAREILDSEMAALKTLQINEQALLRRINQVAKSINGLAKKEFELGKITLGVSDLESVHSMLLKQREEAKISADKQEYSIKARVIESAVTPRFPVRPNRPLYILLGFLVALVVAFGLSFFVEYFDHSLNTAEDAQNCLGLPLLATISDIQSLKTEQPKQGQGKQKPDSK